MKNKNCIIKLLTISLILLFKFVYLYADDVIIDAQEVDIKEKGNLIVASGSVIISDGNYIDISGEKVKYNKVTQIVEVEGNVIF